MGANKIIAISLLSIPCSLNAEIIATTSGPVILNISDLIVEISDTVPQNSVCEGYSRYHHADFYFFFYADNRKEKIATGCWVNNHDKIHLVGEKISTKQEFEYDQDISEFKFIKSLSSIKDREVETSNSTNDTVATNSEIPKIYEIEFFGDFVKYPKYSTQATLEHYIPDLQCQNFMGEVMCVSEPSDIAAVFIRGINCDQLAAIMFSMEHGKTVGVTCDVDDKTAALLSSKYSTKYGVPQDDKIQVNSMISYEQKWIVGDELHKIAHWSGKDINNHALNKYTINIDKNK